MHVQISHAPCTTHTGKDKNTGMQAQRDTDTLQTGKHGQAYMDTHTLTMMQTYIQGQTSWTYMHINDMQAAGICRREIYAGGKYM